MSLQNNDTAMNETAEPAPSEAQQTITIVTGDYLGDFSIVETKSQTSLGTFHGTQQERLVVVSLLVGKTYEIKVSWGYFFIDVKSNGALANVSNPIAARIEGNSLFFHTKTIVIDPGRYGRLGGKCVFVSHPYKRFGYISSQAREFDIVPGLAYVVDTGAGLADDEHTSYFHFLVGGDGSVWSDSCAAKGCGNTLHLNCGVVEITPSDSRIKYDVGVNCCAESPSQPSPPFYKGTKRVPVIVGALTKISVPEQHVSDNQYGPAEKTIFPQYGFGEERSVVVGGFEFKWSLLSPNDVCVVGVQADGNPLRAVVQEDATEVRDTSPRSIVVAGDHSTVLAGYRGAAIAGFESSATALREGLAYVLNGSATCIGHSGIAITRAGGTARAVDKLAVTLRGGHAIIEGPGIAIAINDHDSMAATVQASKGGLIVLGYFLSDGTIKYVAATVDDSVIKAEKPYKLELDQNAQPVLTLAHPGASTA